MISNICGCISVTRHSSKNFVIGTSIPTVRAIKTALVAGSQNNGFAPQILPRVVRITFLAFPLTFSIAFYLCSGYVTCTEFQRTGIKGKGCFHWVCVTVGWTPACTNDFIERCGQISLTSLPSITCISSPTLLALEAKVSSFFKCASVLPRRKVSSLVILNVYTKFFRKVSATYC